MLTIKIIGSVLIVTDKNVSTRYVNQEVSYWPEGSILNFEVRHDAYKTDIPNLRIGASSTAPADIDAALTTLDLLFPNEGGGSSTPGSGASVPPVAFAASRATANLLVEGLTPGQLVRVQSDETNNNDKSMYLYTQAGTLEFQYTIFS